MRLRSTLILTALLAVCGCEREPATPDGSTTTPGGEDTAATCSDGIDNDGDEHVDCNDFDCCGVVTCGGDTACGSRPDGGNPGDNRCDGPSAPENTPAACSDGCNNDYDSDTFADCNDFDCCDHRTDCPADTACGSRPGRCEGNPRPENTLEACTNGCSDDDDTFVDCAERDCCWIIAEAVARGVPGIEACGSGTFCADSFTPPASAALCEDDDLMGVPELEDSFERCTDECSNERGPFQDCGNFDCCPIIERAVAEGVPGAVACGAGTACADMWTPRPGVELCAGDDGTGDPDPENTLEACSNDCDDDRNGFEDCNDRGCCSVRTDCPTGTFCGDRSGS